MGYPLHGMSRPRSATDALWPDGDGGGAGRRTDGGRGQEPPAAAAACGFSNVLHQRQTGKFSDKTWVSFACRGVMSGESSRCWPCGAEDLTVCHWPLSGTKNELFLNVPSTDNREVDWLLGRGRDSAVFSTSFLASLTYGDVLSALNRLNWADG